MDRFLRFNVERKDATLVGVPFELNPLFLTQPQQMIDNPDNTARGR